MSHVNGFEGYLRFAEEIVKHNPHQRKGQAYFNALQEVHPGLATTICSSNSDPFYRDERLSDFLKVVRDNWDAT